MSEGWTDSKPFDWNNTSEDGPPPLADGVYYVQVVAAEPKKSKANNPMIKLKLQATHAYGGSTGDLNRTIFDNLTLTEAAAFRVKNACKRFGVDLPADQSYGAALALCEALLDSEGCWARTQQEEYNGRVNAKIAKYLSPEEADEAAGDAEPSATARRKRR